MKKDVVFSHALGNTELVKATEICRELKISKSTLYKHVKLGRFPKPIKLTPRTSAWIMEEIKNLIK